MKKFRVVLTDYRYESIQPFYDVYDKQEDIEFVPMQLHTKEEIMRETEFADAVMVHFEQLDADVIKNLKNCKVIARSAVGVDNIDLAAASEMKIPVANVPDYGIEEVSNHIMLLILSCSKKMNLLERTVHAGKWDYSVIKPVFAIRNKVLGLMGCGNIARGVVKKAQAFGMKVIGYDPFLPQNVFDEFGIERVENLDDLLAQADFVNIQLHHSAATDKIVNADFLHKMKPTAYLINTARGGLVDEAALADAVRDGTIAGAGLDVLSSETIPADYPLLQFDNVIVTPHAAWYTEESMYTLLTSAAAEVCRVLHGEPLKHQVNKF
jgi:D-isomer specific 2-hydroxyacid dehydrogenase, NAD-binding